eukprot:2743577-Rhodomonas_salina.2
MQASGLMRAMLLCMRYAMSDYETGYAATDLRYSHRLCCSQTFHQPSSRLDTRTPQVRTSTRSSLQ